MQSACAVLYCHLWPVQLYHIFQYYLINGTIFGKNLFNKKRVWIFYTNFACNISHYKNSARHYQKCTQVFKWTAGCYCQILKSMNFLKRLKLYENIKYLTNPSSGSRVVPCGRTDGRMDGRTEWKTDRQIDKHDEHHSRFSQYCKRAQKPTSSCWIGK
jgi:hypothetical protein